MNLFLLSGGFHISVYVTIFFCAWLAFSVINFTRISFLKAVGLTLILYISPVIFSITIFLGFVIWLWMVQVKNENERVEGTFEYRYDFFHGDGAFYFVSPGGSSSFPVRDGDTRIPNVMRDAVRRALSVNPYQASGDVVVRTTVNMRNNKPVITDHYVSREQIKSYEQHGAWDVGKEYVAHVSNINVVTGDLEWATDDKGRVKLPAPAGLDNQFMSQFNGPDLHTRVRR